MSDTPFFTKHIFFCTQVRPEGHPAGCCAHKGSNDYGGYMREKVADMELDGVRVNGAGCLGRCDLGPAMVVYPEGNWYKFESTGDVDEIIQAELVDNTRAERLLLP